MPKLKSQIYQIENWGLKVKMDKSTWGSLPDFPIIYP